MKSTRSKHFSLIELLIVISIFALIASLLQPSLTKMISMARSTECTTKQKNIGNFVMFYIDDHNGILPGPASGFIYPWANRELASHLKPYLGPTTPFTRSNGANLEYVKEFSCPSNMEPNDSTHDYRERVSYITQSRWDFFGTSYYNKDRIEYFGRKQKRNPVNWRITQKEIPPSPFSLINTPSQTILVRDTDMSHHNKPNHNQTEAPAHPPVGGRNILLFDLSVMVQNSFTEEYLW